MNVQTLKIISLTIYKMEMGPFHFKYMKWCAFAYHYILIVYFIRVQKIHFIL